MLDLKLIRSDPERVKAALARRGAAEGVDELLALDARRRELLPEVENAQAERKALSKRIGEARQAGEAAEDLMARVQALKETIESGKAELERTEAELEKIAVALPNLPDPGAPDGMTEEDAVVDPRGRQAARVRLRAARPPGDRHRAGPDRYGGGGAALRLPLRLPEGRPGASGAGSGALRDRAGPRRGARAGRSRRSSSARRLSTAPASSPATATRSTRCPRTSCS